MRCKDLRSQFMKTYLERGIVLWCEEDVRH